MAEAPEAEPVDPVTRLNRRLYAWEYGFSRLLEGMKAQDGLDGAEWDQWARSQPFYLNLELLFHAADSYFQDIDRMKSYRAIQFCDAHKQAAFTMKWIMAIRPVQIREHFIGLSDGPEIQTARSLLINEIYAAHLSLAYLGLETASLPDAYYGNMLYMLHFHPVQAEQTAAEMYLLEQCALGGRFPALTRNP